MALITIKQHNNKTTEKGFTLIEILVAVAIFALVVGTTSGLFISGIRTQRNVLTSQIVLDNTSYAIEYMGRAIRMAKKQMPELPACLSQNGLNYEITGRGGLKFLNYQKVCQEFFLDPVAKRLKESKGGSEQFLTSDNLQILSFNFNLQGQLQTDNLQPRVTIFLDAMGVQKELKPEEQAKIRIQTTVSQRNLDVAR